MSLFTIIPENFFSVLASPNRAIYADALLVLYQALATDELTIKKSDYLRTLKDKATNEILLFDLAADGEVEDEEEMSQVSSQTLTYKTSAIIRRLEETGWIDIQIDPNDFEEYIALPSYAISFLQLLDEIISKREGTYVSLVHATYSELRLEDDDPDEFMYATLMRAYENTRELRTELVTLGHSIRIFQNRLGRVFSTNSILRDYFDNYKEHVSDRYYHPLKTFDSVAKFKRPIITILQRWLRDEEIRALLVNQAMIYTRKKDALEVERDLIEKINYICDMYETLNEMINQIDDKHREYTKASASKILYLNAQDKTIKGHLDNIFRYYAEGVLTGSGIIPILRQMQEAVILNQQGMVDSDSITLPIVRRYRQESEPLAIIDFGDVSEMLMRGFLDETRNIFTDERVYSFMETAFGDASEMKIEEIPLPDFDAFILLILASLKTNDEHCFYTIDMEEGNVLSQGYSLPRFTFKRKELEV
ncbi:MAG: Wadjet anti-phage system protein JetA family protein [Bacilli bacterium]